MDTACLQVDQLKIVVHGSRQAAGEGAARAAAESIRRIAGMRSTLGVIFATGASQLEMLRALVATPGLPWEQVVGFHMDEYLGIGADHPASFRHYLREHLTSPIHGALSKFYEIDGSAADAGRVRAEYAALLRLHNPQLCLLGIGENGHLAFNDPAEADFEDTVDMKVVSLDITCRQQQVAEGWFGSLEEVPRQALTLTIPALMRVPELIVSVPGERKAGIMKRVLEEPVSTACPATILRTHPNATVFLDEDSAAELSLIGLELKK